MQRNKSLETVVVIILGLVAVYWFKKASVLLVLAFLIGAAAVVAPPAAAGIHWAWTKLSQLLGAVTGRILLTVVYILVLIPLSLLARVFGKSGLKLRPGKQSYFNARNHQFSKEDIIHPW
jgi:hypothetical protein